MRSKEIADRYAEALYDLGREEGILDELEKDYRIVWNSTKDLDEFKRFFSHPLIPNSRKFDLMRELFQDLVHPHFIKYLQLLIRKNRENYLGYIFKRLQKIREEKEEIVRVRVHTPFEIEGDGLLNRIEQKLKEISGKEVRLETVIDEGLLAGIKLEVGEKVIDGSMKARINRLEEMLMSREAGE